MTVEAAAAMSASEWPKWPRSDLDALSRHVVPDEVAAHAAVPGPSDDPVLVRLRAVWDALCAVGIGLAKEGIGADALGRRIRPPAEVLVAPRSGTCLDLAVAVVLAAAALHAGLQAAVLVLEPEATGRAELAVVAVLPDSAWPEPLTADRAWPTPPPDLLLAAQRALDGPPRPLLVLDPRDLTRSPGVDLAQAALDGYALLDSSELHPRACVRARRRPDAYRPATVTGVPPLRAPYRAPESAESALRLLRAEYGVTPFQARDELTVLRQVADEAARDGRMSVAVVTGRGGAGKTRLALQLVADLNADGWYGGVLRERPDQPDGLVPVVAPVAVVVDYAESRPQRVRELLSTLGRRESATLVVLTARSDDGDWLSMIDDAAASTRAATSCSRSPMPIPAPTRSTN